MSGKRCCSCKQELDRSKFGKNKARKDGLATSCRVCANIQSMIRYYGNDGLDVLYERFLELSAFPEPEVYLALIASIGAPKKGKENGKGK